MQKKVVYIILIALLIGLLFALKDIKEAYKVIPITTSEKMEVPEFAQWREYKPDVNKFKVLLPDPPQYAKESVVIPNTNKYRRYEMYVSQKLDGTVFMISLISYPEGFDINDKNILLHGSVDEMLTTRTNNRLSKIEDVTVQNYPAVDYKITNDEFNVEGRAIAVDRTVFLLSYIAKKHDFSENDYEHFVNSFVILDGNKQIR